jgi:hypothetical protein
MTLLTKELAVQYLSSVDSAKKFHLYQGASLSNIEDLFLALQSISDQQFLHHRNEQKNDFYNWVLHVITDSKLANDIARAKTQKTMAKKIGERVTFLKSRAEER